MFSNGGMSEYILMDNIFLLHSLQYFVFDFHVPPDVMFDKIIKLSVSKRTHCGAAEQTITTFSPSL